MVIKPFRTNKLKIAGYDITLTDGKNLIRNEYAKTFNKHFIVWKKQWSETCKQGLSFDLATLKYKKLIGEKK